MATIDDKTLIDKLIAANGYFDDDPRVHMIVQYTNSYGKITWGVTWTNETKERRLRYLDATPHVRNPKVIWHCETK